jgi:hypothetical protein
LLSVWYQITNEQEEPHQITVKQAGGRYVKKAVQRFFLSCDPEPSAQRPLGADLIKAEHFGSFVRLTFGVPDQSANCPDEPPTMIVVAKLIVPPDALMEMMENSPIRSP